MVDVAMAMQRLTSLKLLLLLAIVLPRYVKLSVVVTAGCFRLVLMVEWVSMG